MINSIRWQSLNPSATASDAVDWERVYHEELPRVFNFFRYHVGEELAEDLTATTFERAWRGRAQYHHERAAFSTWLFTIARNVATDHWRKQRAEVSLEAIHTMPAQTSPEDIAEQHAEFARLSVLLAQLPLRERELLALKYGADLTNRAIAKVVGLSESNVGTILHRALTALRVKW